MAMLTANAIDAASSAQSPREEVNSRISCGKPFASCTARVARSWSPTWTIEAWMRVAPSGLIGSYPKRAVTRARSPSSSGHRSAPAPRAYSSRAVGAAMLAVVMTRQAAPTATATAFVTRVTYRTHMK